MSDNSGNASGLKPYVTKTGAFALSVGCSVGWGSMVVSNNEYLLHAGPLGSCVGMVIGTLIMFIIAANFIYMSEFCRDSGGIYSYVKNVFGYDRAFLISWFLSLTYIAILWANATSIPLFSRYFLGNMFCFGHLYNLFGYDVYLGEIILTSVVTLIFAIICMKSASLSCRLIVITVFLFIVGICVCFLAAIFGNNTAERFEPAMIPDAKNVQQVLKIIFITPWAFIGFESITHSAEEFSFEQKSAKRILYVSLIVSALIYMFIFLLSVTAFPPAYSNWLEYLMDLDNLSGIEGLPAFYAAYSCMGNVGVIILMISLLGLVFSSLIGNMVSLSRLFYALARDRILPARYEKLTKEGIPDKAILLVLLLSVPVLFIGRIAVSWIVDITTIGATLLYGFVSAATLRQAQKDNNNKSIATGAAGFVLMIIFGVYIIFGSIFDGGGISHESQLLLIIWSVLGLLYFRLVMVRDHGNRFGKNLTVWAVLVFMIFGLSMLWIGEEGSRMISENLLEVRNHYSSEMIINNIEDDPFMLQYRQDISKMITMAAVCMIGVFAISFGAMFSNFGYVRRREEEAKRELGDVRSKAYVDPLTGVKSKHAYAETEEVIDEAIVQRRIEQFAVVVFDVNGLKHINDTRGHKAGDQYIKDASMLICHTFSRSPVYRIGGDEFVAILNGRDFPDRKELLKSFNEQVEKNISSGHVVISAGMSDFNPAEDEDFHTVIDHADRLMYERKQQLKAQGAITRA